MKNLEIFCSACDRAVNVLITKAPAGETQANVQDQDEVVCLEIGGHCNGNMCPIGAVEPGAMVRRIIRNGVPLNLLETVRAVCPACGVEAEMILYGEGKAACSICAAPARWTVDHIEADVPTSSP